MNMNGEKLTSANALVSILLVESDRNFGTILEEFLKHQGYEVKFVTDGLTAADLLISSHYDILITETELAGKNGYSLVKELRQMGNQMPAIFLSRESSKEAILQGYEVGGDDFISKPCLVEIIIAKIQAMVRRANLLIEADRHEFHFADLLFDSANQYLSFNEKTVKLSSRETELLKMLALRPNKLVERSLILQQIWRADSVYACRSLSVYINHLRNILPENSPIKILSVHGKGYKLVLTVNDNNPE